MQEVDNIIVEDKDGKKIYKGVLHNIRGPAVVTKSGNKYWYINGELHRDGDKPAVIQVNGNQMMWAKNGLYHRENGNPAIVWANGDREWYYNGVLHRDNGPAIESVTRGNQFWINGVKQEEN
jgi:hypothetical protein